jgi:hypothetical protein
MCAGIPDQPSTAEKILVAKYVMFVAGNG